MTSDPRLSQLAQIAGLVRDTCLARLEQAARARQGSLDRLADLSRPVATTDLTPIAAWQAEQRYRQWADARSAEVLVTLQRQTADWETARDAARHAFARSTVIDRLKDQLS
jgi:hypothetical protein